MSLHGELVLASDVEIFPVSELSAETLAQLPHSPGDFVISRYRSRDVSRVIDSDSRDLLLEFKEPSRIVDAVVRFARERGVDPEATLEEAFELLGRLHRAGVLAPTGDATNGPEGASLAPGGELLGLALGPCVHDLTDTQVFFARDASSRPLAVKLIRGGMGRVEHEAEAMRQAGPRVPAVHSVQQWDGRGVLVSEWIVGDDLARVAATLRGQRGGRQEGALLALCAEVVQAFAEIHAAGVLHGDIHPRNVLVEEGGRARVIDLGFAAPLSASRPASRGGIAFYVEPELAAARLRGTIVPASALGEQYAIGALVYLLWTGVHHIDFSLEREAMLRQLADPEPVPFSARHLPPFPELEAILFRALAKDPSARFASCRDFATALRELIPSAMAREALAMSDARRLHKASRELIDSFYERCGIGGAVIRDRPHDAPYASVNYGAAGIAYAFYKLARIKDAPTLLATADVWAEKAVALSSDEKAFFADESEITEKAVGRAALFHSPTGVHAVRALVSLSMGEAGGATRALSDFVGASRVPCEFDDLTLGRAGILLGCAELVEAARGARGVDANKVVERGEELRELVERAVMENVFATSRSMNCLGIAHGWAGMLFSLLRWLQARGTSADRLRAKLDELAALQEPHATGIRWPVSNRTVRRPSYSDGWCNGPAGHALLFALAAELLHVPEYSVLAERAARSTWSAEMRLGTICCGLAGVGYACAAAHRVTGDPLWLRRAKDAAERASLDRSKWFYRDSLYKGGVGVVLLCEELEAGCAGTPLLERR